MAVEQKPHPYQSLRIALIMAVVIGGIYAIWITVRIILEGAWGTASPVIVFGLNFVYCAMPLFVLLWPAIGLLRRVQKE